MTAIKKKRTVRVLHLRTEGERWQKGPPPPPEGRCVQIAADANVRGPPGHVNENEGEEAKDNL